MQQHATNTLTNVGRTQVDAQEFSAVVGYPILAEVNELIAIKRYFKPGATRRSTGSCFTKPLRGVIGMHKVLINAGVKMSA